MAPRVLKKIIPSDSIQSKTVKDSDKALGTAAGAGNYLVHIQRLWSSSMSKKTTVFILPSVLQDLLPNLLQFVFALSMVVWAFRLVAIVKDVVELFDKDGELDGSEKTLTLRG